MLRKIKKLFAIPRPERGEMVRRAAYAYCPALAPLVSRRYAAKLSANAKTLQSRPHTEKIYVGSLAHRSAGIGHALAEWNTGLLLAEALGVEFAHSPVNSPWEEFLGFGRGCPLVGELWRSRNVAKVRLPLVDWNDPLLVQKFHDLVFSHPVAGPTLFVLFTGQNSAIQHTTAATLRSRYFENRRAQPPIPSHRRPNAINVSVHVRRRNALDMKNPTVHDMNSAAYASRYVDIGYFKDLMTAIVDACHGAAVVFNVYSQGSPEKFRELSERFDAYLHLDASETETFHNLATADILITSPSSFSFKAGMICPGLKLARYPWWHEVPNNSEWCRTAAAPLDCHDRITEFVRTNLDSALQRNL
jgi:hypothetical protein